LRCSSLSSRRSFDSRSLFEHGRLSSPILFTTALSPVAPRCSFQSSSLLRAMFTRLRRGRWSLTVPAISSESRASWSDAHARRVHKHLSTFMLASVACRLFDAHLRAHGPTAPRDAFDRVHQPRFLAPDARLSALTFAPHLATLAPVLSSHDEAPLSLRPSAHSSRARERSLHVASVCTEVLRSLVRSRASFDACVRLTLRLT
jgi:hypothetical protein